MLKILHARLQHFVNQELPDVQARFKIGRGTIDQIANICWIIEKAKEFQKNIYFCFIDYAKAFDCVDHNKLWKTHKNCGKLLKRWVYRTILPAFSETCMQQLEPCMEQLTGSGLRKEYDRAAYCHHACLTYIQSTS